MNVQTVNYQGLYFVNVTKPTDFEIKFLKNTYNFDSLNLEDYLHKIQIPKIESHEKYDLIVLRFPIFTENLPENAHQYGTRLSPTYTNSSAKRKLTSGYVNIFVSEENVVFLHDGTLPEINRIFELCQKTLHNRIEYMGKGSTHLVYKIVDALVDDCFPAVNELTSTIDRIDKELEDKPSQKTLEDISTTRRNLVVFHTMIKPIIPILQELKDGKHSNLNGKMKSYWENVLDHLQKVWDRVEDNQELLNGISESNEFLLRSKTNQIMATLTIVFTLTIPASVFGTLYGMNVVLPGGVNEGKDWLFWGPYTTFIIICILSIVPLLLMILWFRYKKWS